MSFLAELQHITKIYPRTNSPGNRINVPSRNTGFKRDGQSEYPVLDDISLTIGYKTSIAIVGPSGSGKTTLLNILGTLDHPTSGMVMIEGAETGKLNDDRLAELRNRRIGFVFQLHYLLPQLSLIENIMLPLLPEKDKKRVKEGQDRAFFFLEKTGLKPLANQQPGKLSVGECQRAAVIRALINQPKLLLADEPTGSLDTVNANMVASLLADLQVETGLSMVVVTHSMEIARHMDQIFQLRDGKLNPTTTL